MKNTQNSTNIDEKGLKKKHGLKISDNLDENTDKTLKP